MVNKVILIGNLGKDAEVIATDKVKIVKFPLATSESYKDKKDEWVNITTWHNIVIFQQYDSQGEDLKTGDRVYLEGQISNSSYEDKEGNKRYRSEVVARKIRKLGNVVKNETSDKEVIDLPF